MNKFFTAAVGRFKKKFGEEFKISPISKKDAEVIVEIKEILRKNGLDEIKEILEDYKFLADEEIVGKLMQYNIDNPEVIDENKQEKIPPRKFIIAKGQRIEVRDIYGYQKKIKKDFNTFDNKYYILLNPTPPEVKKVPLYGNHLIQLDSKQEMEKYVLIFDALMKSKNCEFLDIDEEF